MPNLCPVDTRWTVCFPEAFFSQISCIEMPPAHQCDALLNYGPTHCHTPSSGLSLKQAWKELKLRHCSESARTLSERCKSSVYVSGRKVCD